jgi:hypothetical protein
MSRIDVKQFTNLVVQRSTGSAIDEVQITMPAETARIFQRRLFITLASAKPEDRNEGLVEVMQALDDVLG